MKIENRVALPFLTLWYSFGAYSLDTLDTLVVFVRFAYLDTRPQSVMILELINIKPMGST